MSPSENETGISLGAKIGIVAAGAFVIFLVLGTLWWKCCLGQKNKMEQGIAGQLMLLLYGLIFLFSKSYLLLVCSLDFFFSLFFSHRALCTCMYV
jgi:hypothetical protein